MIRALLVDDEQPARERLRRLLADFETLEIVGEAEDGEQAIESILRLKPDLVFLDIQMPGCTGMEVAASLPSLQLGRAGMIDIVSLASYPLLLLESGYSVRRLFDAACRLADVEPNILLESRAPHTLLALAEAGQGVAIIPSVLRTDRYRLKIARVTHRRKPLRDRYVIQWDKRRPMPSYAQTFCTSLAEYMRKVLPITQPSSSVAARRKRR